MKKVAVIALSYGWLPEEGGTTRFSYLAELLSQYNLDVTLITSSFYHVKKKDRNIKKLMEKKYPYKIVFLHEPGYKKNVSLKRIYSHHIAAKNLKKHLKDNSYDLIYCTLPPNDIAKVAGQYANRKNIPFIVDIEDLWPEGWKIILGQNKIFDLLCFPIKRDAEIAYKYAKGVVGTSNEYTNRIYQNLPEKKGQIPSETVYVSIDINEFDNGVTSYKNDINKKQNEFWITYAGTLGSSYDIGTLIKAAQNLYKKNYRDIKILILGTGPMKEKWEKEALLYPCNVEFLGFVPYSKMAAILSTSDVLINSYVKSAVQSIVTKIGDYLAAGKPMINTCSSKEFREKVETNKFGINIEAESPEELEKAILYFYNNQNEGEAMGRTARNVAEQEFARGKSYLKIVRMVQKFLA